MSSRVACTPSSSSGMCTVVSGGDRRPANGASWKLTTDRSRGTSTPRCRQAAKAPTDAAMLADATAVGTFGWPRSRSMPAKPSCSV